MAEYFGRYRDASGTWREYEIDDSGDPIVMQINPQTMEIYPEARAPFMFEEDETVGRGSYVVQVRVNCTFRSTRQGVRYWNTVIALPFTARARTAVSEMAEEVVEEWVMDNFYDQSPPEIDIEDVSVERRSSQSLAEMPMRGVGTIEQFLRRVSPVRTADASKPMVYASNMDIEHHPDGAQCVADYLLWEAAKKDARKGHWTRVFLTEQLGASPTVNRIIQLAKKEQDVSVFAVDCMMRLFAKHLAVKQPRVWLVFMVKEYHCLPITNEKWRQFITRREGVEMEDITFDRWSFEEAVFYDEDEGDMVSFLNGPPLFEEPKKTVRILPVDNLNEVAAEVMGTTGMVIERAKWARSAMVAFVHPNTNVIIVAGSDFVQRREFCDAMFRSYKLNDFVFTNQSWGTLAFAYLESKHARLPPSTYPVEYLDILKRYPLGPYRACLAVDKTLRDGDVGIDVRRCYSAILRNSQQTWAVFGPLDHVVAYPDGLPSADCIRAGEYYVNTEVMMGGGTIQLSRGWYPHNFVTYAVQKKYVRLCDITFALRASSQLDADVFTAFCDDVDANYPDVSKQMLNQMIGCFGQQTKNTTRTGCTVDLETAVATLAEIQIRGNDGSMFIHKGTAILQEVERRPKTHGHVPIYRAILAGSWALLDEMYSAIVIPGVTQVLAYNTDSIKVRGSYNRGSILPKDDCKWGQWHEEDPLGLSGRPLRELPIREDYVLTRQPVTYLSEESGVDCFTALCGNSGLILGPPGCGKTYLLAKLWETVGEDECGVVTAYTHAACQNLRDKGLPAVVFSSLVFNAQTQKMDPTRLQGTTILLLDEYTMLPPDEMRVLLTAAKEYGFRVWAAGDYRQCPAPVDNPVEYHTNPLFLDMCGNRVVTLQYKVGTGRYDDSLYQAILQFQQTGRLTAWKDAAPGPDLCMTNICLTNAKRKQLNTACLTRWLETTVHGLLVNVGTVKTPFSVCTGLQVMAYHAHVHEYDILKTQIWTVQAIDTAAETITLVMQGREPVTLPFKQFNTVFDYAFAMTVQKCQGLTVPEYAVHELDHPRMSFNVVYTAISRGVTQSRVFLKGVRHWDRVYAPVEMNAVVTLKGVSIAPMICPVVIYRLKDERWAATYIGCISGPKVDGWSADSVKRLVKQTGLPDGMPVPDMATEAEEVAFLYVRPGADVDGIWNEYIQRELTETGSVYNVPASVPAAVDTTWGTLLWEEVAPKDADAMSTSDTSHKSATSAGSKKRKFQPVDCEQESTFLVRCRARGIEKHHRTRCFGYDRTNPASKEAARQTAEAWSARMIETYF